MWQVLDLVQVAVLVVTDTTLERAADIGVLHTIALEHPNAAVVHFYGKIHLRFPLGIS